MAKKEFVEFYFPGISCAGQKEREISSRELDLSELIRNGAISYRFFSKNENNNNVNYSPYYYIGKEYSIEEFKVKYPQLATDSDLITAHRIVKTFTGGFYPLSEMDIVVSK